MIGMLEREPVSGQNPPDTDTLPADLCALPELASSDAFTHCSRLFLTDGSFFASQDPIW